MPLSDQDNSSTSNSRILNFIKIPNIKIDTGEHNTNYNVGTNDKLLIFDTLEQAQNWIVSYEAEHGYIFVKVKTTPFESEAILDDLLTKLSKRMRWLLTTHFSNKGFAELVPFIVLNGHRTLHCHHGPDRHKAFKLKQMIKSQMKENPPVLRVELQPSKKLECPAKIRLNQRLFFPDHKVANYASHHEKNKAIHDLKQLVVSNTNVVKKEARIMICLNYANANKHSDHKIGAEDCERHGMKVMRKKMKRKERKLQHKRKSKTPNVAKPTINQELNLLKPMSPMESFYQSSNTSDIIEIKFIDNDMTELEVQNEPSNSNSLETPEDSDGDSEDRFFALMALEARGIPKHKRLKLHTDIVKLVYKARYEND